MAQQQINYGNVANDGTGDPLRSAFIKTDDNFDEIYAAGPVSSNITITNNSITATNTNGNITLATNGVGVINTNSLIPSTSNTYTLGSSTGYYRSAYIGTGGVTVLGNITAGNLVGTTVGTHTGTVVGDVTGSVFADDSTLLVDGVNGVLRTDTLSQQGAANGQALLWNSSSSQWAPGNITVPVDTNTYVNAAAFNVVDGVLTLTKNDASTVTANLDGRYLTSVAFGDLTSTPTTIAGYGITDAFDGQYSSLTGAPTLANVATSGAYSDLSGTPTLANVATSGAYSDLSGTPVLANVATSGAYSDLSGTPVLANVATSGAYSDLSGAPTNVSTFTNDAAYIESDPTGITGADAVTNIVSLTQAEYDAIGTPDASTVYFIIG